MNRIDDPAASPAHKEHAISANGRLVERIWYPDMPLLESVRDQLVDACQSSALEQCGLISTGFDVFYVDNVHEEPHHNFLFDRNEYTIAVNEIFGQSEAILGVFHTHPNNVVWPSPRDIRGWPVETDWRYWIVTNAEVIEWAMVCPGH